MTPNNPGSIPPNIATALAEINARVEHVAMTNPANSDLNILAYAIHNLIHCIRVLHGEAG